MHRFPENGRCAEIRRVVPAPVHFPLTRESSCGFVRIKLRELSVFLGLHTPAHRSGQLEDENARPAVHADSDVPNPGPGVQSAAKGPEGSVIRGHRTHGEAKRRDEESAALVEHAYSITWSARSSSDCGMARPSAFAVLRLMTRSSRAACSTGRSAGLAPLRMRSMYPARDRPISG